MEELRHEAARITPEPRVDHGDQVRLAALLVDVPPVARIVDDRRAAELVAAAFLVRQRVLPALVVLHALGHGRVALVDALEFHEAGDFSHDVFLQGVLFVRMGEDALMDSGVRRNDEIHVVAI